MSRDNDRIASNWCRAMSRNRVFIVSVNTPLALKFCRRGWPDWTGWKSLRIGRCAVRCGRHLARRSQTLAAFIASTGVPQRKTRSAGNLSSLCSTCTLAYAWITHWTQILFCFLNNSSFCCSPAERICYHFVARITKRLEVSGSRLLCLRALSWPARPLKTWKKKMKLNDAPFSRATVVGKKFIYMVISK
jgi:hypothetical protein